MAASQRRLAELLSGASPRQQVAPVIGPTRSPALDRTSNRLTPEARLAQSLTGFRAVGGSPIASAAQGGFTALINIIAAQADADARAAAARAAARERAANRQSLSRAIGTTARGVPDVVGFQNPDFGIEAGGTSGPGFPSEPAVPAGPQSAARAIADDPRAAQFAPTIFDLAKQFVPDASKQVNTLSADEVQALGLPLGTIVQRDANGRISIPGGRAANSPPPTRTRNVGDQVITEQFNQRTGEFEEVGRAPRFRPESTRERLISKISRGEQLTPGEQRALNALKDTDPLKQAMARALENTGAPSPASTPNPTATAPSPAPAVPRVRPQTQSGGGLAPTRFRDVFDRARAGEVIDRETLEGMSSQQRRQLLRALESPTSR